MTTVITNPKTGRMETTISPPTPPVTKADVDKTRRELRDMLDGNTQFHEDALSSPTTEPQPNGTHA